MVRYVPALHPVIDKQDGVIWGCAVHEKNIREKIPGNSNRQGMAGFIFYLVYHGILTCGDGGED